MVVGRLNRESNPVPGEKPGFTPQHKLPDGSFIDTGEANPLPTKDDLVYQELDILKQLISDQQALTKKVEVTNQKFTQTVDGTVGINNFPTDQKVSDSDVLTKLSELDSKINGIIDGSTPADTQLVGSSVEELISNQKTIINVMQSDKLVFGVHWDKTSDPVMTRLDASIGLEANVGVDGQLVKNDFDRMPIYSEISEVTDSLGNKFIRIPKFYIRKRSGKDFMIKQISKTKYPGFYLPNCFLDFENNKELDFFDFGKHKASLSADSKLESKSGEYPLINKNIVQFRTYAQNNNDATAMVNGYQQLDIHAYDVLQTLFYVEFATLDSQSIMRGFTAGEYSGSHIATVAESGTNRIIVANATADAFRSGGSISLGTSRGGNQITYGRTITAIGVYDVDNKTVVFDGGPVDIAIGNYLYNTGWKSGYSADIASFSGSIGSNSDGKYPCVYRGIESPWGDTYQFVDGVNINDNQTWVAKNANDYASNVFASPYEKLSYINLNANGYVTEMGLDNKNPFAEFPVEIGGSNYYADYYYQNSGQRIAHVGGGWVSGSSAGLSCWYLAFSSAYAVVSIGGRLLKKAL